jgi:hypothetical protein
MKVPDSPGAQLLSGFGVDYDRARDMVAGVLIGFQAGRKSKKP